MQVIGTKLQRSNWPLALVVAVPALAVFETRGLFDSYRDVLRWMLERGVPSALFRLDGYLLLLLGALLGARLAAGRGEVLRSLGAENACGKGLMLGSIIGLPSLLLAPFVSDGPVWPGAGAVPMLVAPVAFEAFFRGLLVSIPCRLGGRRFWGTAALAGLAFGTVSISWGDVTGWEWVPDFCVMTVEGVWLAWLLRCYGSNLWVTIGVSAVMRAAWTIFNVSDGVDNAAPWPDVAFGISAVVGTLMAIRHRRGQSHAPSHDRGDAAL